MREVGLAAVVTAVIPLVWQQPVIVELRSTLRGRELLLNTLRRKENTVVGWHDKGTRFAGPWVPCAHRRCTVAGSARAVMFEVVMTIDRERKGSRVPVDDGRWTTQRVCGVWVNIVLRIEALLIRLVGVGYEKSNETELCQHVV